MKLLTGLLVLLMEYCDEDECDCEGAGTCRSCLSCSALAEAARDHPLEYREAEIAWGREVEARFRPGAIAV